MSLPICWSLRGAGGAGCGAASRRCLLRGRCRLFGNERIFAARPQDQETSQNRQRNAASNQKSCLHGEILGFRLLLPIIRRSSDQCTPCHARPGGCSTGMKLLYLLTSETWNRLGVAGSEFCPPRPDGSLGRPLHLGRAIGITCFSRKTTSRSLSVHVIATALGEYYASHHC